MFLYSIRLIRFGRNRETSYKSQTIFILRKYVPKRSENRRSCKRGRKHQAQKKELHFCNPLRINVVPPHAFVLLRRAGGQVLQRRAGWVRAQSARTREVPLLQIENYTLHKQSVFYIPGTKALTSCSFSPGMQKPAPIGAGFLLDVVPPGLEPGTP